MSSVSKRAVRPNLKDVAQHAGVALSTVSRVVNGGDHISPEMRERVVTSVRALGYEPNALAQSMRTGQTMSIGLVITDISNPLFSTIALGIESCIEPQGYTMLLTNSRADPTREAQLIHGLQRRRIDGLVLALGDESNLQTRRLLAELETPFVLLDRDSDDSRADRVVVDHRSGVLEALRHLVALGHRRVGLIPFPGEIRPGREVRAAFSEGVSSLGLVRSAELVRGAVAEVESAYRAAAELMALPEPPTAILAAGGMIATGVLRLVRDRGIKIPEELSLVGFDDTETARLVTPALTVVARDAREIGRQAGTLLLQRLANPEGPRSRTAALPTWLIVRESTGQAPT